MLMQLKIANIRIGQMPICKGKTNINSHYSIFTKCTYFILWPLPSFLTHILLLYHALVLFSAAVHSPAPTLAHLLPTSFQPHCLVVSSSSAYWTDILILFTPIFFFCPSMFISLSVLLVRECSIATQLQVSAKQTLFLLPLHVRSALQTTEVQYISMLLPCSLYSVHTVFELLASWLTIYVSFLLCYLLENYLQVMLY